MGPHVNERIAEFVFEELSAAEMTDAKRHLAQCTDCREQVEQFQTTHAMLRTSADVEPPRRVMFEFEKRQEATWIWRWLAPMAASAAVAFAVVSLTPRPAPQIVDRVVQQQAPVSQAVQPVAAEPVDYQKIQAWLTSELNRRDAAHTTELRRVKGDIAWLERFQDVVSTKTEKNVARIEYLASLTPAR